MRNSPRMTTMTIRTIEMSTDAPLRTLASAPARDTGPEHSVLDEFDPADERRAQLQRVGGLDGSDDISPAEMRARRAQTAAQDKAEADDRTRRQAADARLRDLAKSRGD